MPVRLSPGVALGSALLAVAMLAGDPIRSLALLFAGTIASLLLHELAHGVAAQRFGFDVERVELSLVGGRVVWSGTDPDAHTALVIAAAGPAASAVLAGGFAVAGVEVLAAMNLLAAVANLLPFRELDGGVIWRALRA